MNLQENQLRAQEAATAARTKLNKQVRIVGIIAALLMAVILYVFR